MSFPHPSHHSRTIPSFPHHPAIPAPTYVIPAKAGIWRPSSDDPSLPRVRGELGLPNAVCAVELPGDDSRNGVLRKVDAG